jgi:hypothetical protein
MINNIGEEIQWLLKAELAGDGLVITTTYTSDWDGTVSRYGVEVRNNDTMMIYARVDLVKGIAIVLTKRVFTDFKQKDIFDKAIDFYLSKFNVEPAYLLTNKT